VLEGAYRLPAVKRVNWKMTEVDALYFEDEEQRVRALRILDKHVHNGRLVTLGMCENGALAYAERSRPWMPGFLSLF
jgi:hypothetical protein